ncbi:hypothetical protein BDF21DRAFT_430077 [Thamnidium elegans]|nr:hypothetical protein BDF21DRAFT_430077 [Thamnidium elegans]
MFSFVMITSLFMTNVKYIFSTNNQVKKKDQAKISYISALFRVTFFQQVAHILRKKKSTL